MPFRTVHNCIVNEEVSSIENVKRKKTKFGIIQYVMGRDKKGALKIRAIRIPVSISLGMARELCNSVKGVFYPATPKEPRTSLLTDFNGLCLAGQKAILQSLIYDFELPFSETKSVAWSEDYVKGLPDSNFFVVTDKISKSLKRVKVRYLPYRDKFGSINKNQVMVALSQINKLPIKADMKKKAFGKIMNTIMIMGIPCKERKNFKLSSFLFYLDTLSLLERKT